MKMTYSILWFDDDEDYLESVDVEPITERIESWGFTPNIVMVSEPEDFMKHAPFKDFDLVAVDYNLEAFDEHGENFIKKLREHGVYTEVIFYSANRISELWDAVRKEQLEGVFVASRTSGGEITKIINVAQQSVHKFLDLNNVRGVIMSEVGCIDQQLEKIAIKYFEELDEQDKKSIINDYVAKVKEQNRKNSENVEILDGSVDIDKMLSYLDSAKKWNICQSLSKKHDLLDVNSVGNYQADVLKPRNFLAHGIPELQEDGSLLFEHLGREYIFSDEEGVSVRKRIQYYSAQFDEII